ncbi:hypothetical protein I5M32_05900 [Pedobacter sp. SD-b]|uniref:Uncharacterized protein n=1 Tax=Pedobacter segetis TaxID=2793069 RepID=A0ABS1BHX3_9SPHI|nr:hypothetical protein [Pedobacter segetis]MBK0382490.1 hypothetical protein [Pedobacter segetis]
MSEIYKSLLLRYQNYFLEFYQLLEDKEATKPKDLSKAVMVKGFFESLPEFDANFEIEMSIATQMEGLKSVWTAQFNEDGFSVRSYTLDGLDELNEWFFHYHDDIKEYEGNLFTDGDWDLFLEEIAEIDNQGLKDVEIDFVFNN